MEKLVYLANTFNLHNVVILEKYPRMARVLSAKYQQSKRYGIIIEHFLLRFFYVNRDIGSKTTSVANSGYLSMTTFYQIFFSLCVCPSYPRPKSRKRSAQKRGFQKDGFSQKSITAWYFIIDSVIFTEIRRWSDKSYGKLMNKNSFVKMFILSDWNLRWLDNRPQRQDNTQHNPTAMERGTPNCWSV